jgi:hypothetical protein
MALFFTKNILKHKERLFLYWNWKAVLTRVYSNDVQQQNCTVDSGRRDLVSKIESSCQ